VHFFCNRFKDDESEEHDYSQLVAGRKSITVQNVKIFRQEWKWWESSNCRQFCVHCYLLILRLSILEVN